jgi:uncharacterized phage protein (TIGR02218 family)
VSDFPTREASTHDAEPFELYRFSRGGHCWAYTSYHEPRLYDGLLYRPAAIERGEIEMSEESSSAMLDVTLERRLAVVPQFLRGLPPEPVWLRVHRGHRDLDDNQVVTLFWGQVAAATRESGRLKLQCASVQAALEKRIPRMVYQRMCNHALYDAGCGVDPEQWKTLDTVHEVMSDGRVVLAGGAATKPTDHYTAGVLRVAETGERAFISAHTQVTVLRHARLTLMHRPEGLAPGMAVEVYAGCDRRVTTCGEKFANVANFTGFPFFPDRNPFDQLRTEYE